MNEKSQKDENQFSRDFTPLENPIQESETMANQEPTHAFETQEETKEVIMVEDPRPIIEEFAKSIVNQPLQKLSSYSIQGCVRSKTTYYGS